MSVENDFIPFAVGGSANVLSQTAYAALTSLTQNGFSAGIAPSVQLNKVWRQSSIMAAVIASFIVQETGQTAIDDGTTATLLANFTNAVNAASKTRVVLTDTGTANAYAAANPVPLTSLPTATGFTQTVKIAHLNTGTSTYAPDGLATAPIYSLAGALLQGNELPVNGVATLVSFVDPLLNSGSLCWVLYECVGGAQPVAPATASQHAVQMQQMIGVVGSVRNLVMSVTAASATATLTADEIVVETALGGLRYCLSSFNKTINLATIGAGGMDTGSAPVSGYVALYAIYNPTTQTAALLATNATSVVAPNVYGGANMPSGYTASALLSVWPTNSSSQFVVGLQQDRAFFFNIATAFNSSTTQASLTAISLATYFPRNAKSFDGSMGFSSSAISVMNISIASSSGGLGQKIFSLGGVTSSGNVVPLSNIPLLTAQTIYYAASSSAGTPTFVIYVSGYTI